MSEVYLSLDKKFRLQYEPSQASHVLLFPEGMIQLNDSAAAILQLCDGSHTETSIVESLQADFPDVDISRDVTIFIGDAHDKGWITKD